VLFMQGQFALGLVAAWLMTFLDTVDGKLARVTVSYTRFGDWFDHSLDLVHPPLWYLAWGMGIAAASDSVVGLPLGPTVVLIVVGYVLGRLVEGTFSFWLGGFSIFSWRPIDSYSRLITARRNPCLILLTVGLTSGRPDLGLGAVAVWTLLSTLFLLLRLATAWYQRRTTGPLRSWLTEIDPKAGSPFLAIRWFAPVAAIELSAGTANRGGRNP
jgi:phosphatidylglycerophosphate synthase